VVWFKEHDLSTGGLGFPIVPLLSGIHPSKLEVTLLDSFGVTFGTEGESVSLVANMVVVPDLPNLPPEAMWYRDGEMLHFSV